MIRDVASPHVDEFADVPVTARPFVLDAVESDNGLLIVVAGPNYCYAFDSRGVVDVAAMMVSWTMGQPLAVRRCSGRL